MDDFFLRASKNEEKEDFRYNYCDYDMSRKDTQESFDGHLLIQDEDKVQNQKFTDQWDDRAKAPYFTAYETKNA